MSVLKPIRFTVAIDGPAASGKGTVAKGIADHFGFKYLDTGLLYRAIGAEVLLGKDPINAAAKLVPSDMTLHSLRSPQVTKMASKVAAIPEVRATLLAFQKNFARQKGGAVLDGRDIGTIICPGADVKIFITASAELRALRRFRELHKNGLKTTYDVVLIEVKERDARDISRKASPLKPAQDAYILDTSDLNIETSLKRAIDITHSGLKKVTKK